ncbi:TIGR03618 family F420-dependent PPOX class oxidoreductase [Egicoccus sp. AB-alg6-2]|uniref:TIGR03618 family F420-dependent PPOX class oxidoreductase n=1 Tax=Egicoccus sp. AB-alg6-2 TaxID=3242692 RepID=UPI00359F08ED
MPLEPQVKTYATGRNFAALTTLFSDGTPQTQVMWVDADDDHLLINTEVHRQKFKNVSADPRVTVLIWNADNPYEYVEVRGRVVDVVRGQEARDHIDACAQRYVGRDYDPKAITSERAILKIAPERQLVRP